MAKQTKMVPRSVAIGVGVAGAVLLVGQFLWWNKKAPNVLKKGY
jgi:hypothetical protein